MTVARLHPPQRPCPRVAVFTDDPGCHPAALEPDLRERARSAAGALEMAYAGALV
jgi:hypothetical protein